MLIFNYVALIPIVIAAACGAALSAATGSPTVGYVVAYLAAIGVDLYLRVKDLGTDGLLKPSAGGHIWFVPVWVWAVLSGVFGLVANMNWI